MSIDSIVTAPQDASQDPVIDQAVDQAVDQVVDDPAAGDVEELLVEEVSIDGMCGVY
jgi:mycofactocin precursor